MRERKHNIVHDHVNQNAVKRAVDPRVTGEWKSPAGEKINCGPRCSDEEVEQKAERNRARTHGVRGAANQPKGDALQNACGGDSPEPEKNDGVEDVQSANEETGSRDDLDDAWASSDSGCHVAPIVAIGQPDDRRKFALVRNAGICLDLDAPAWIKQFLDDHHRRSRPND